MKETLVKDDIKIENLIYGKWVNRLFLIVKYLQQNETFIKERDDR